MPLAGCIAELGLLDDGWTRLPDCAAIPPKPAAPTPPLPPEQPLIEIPPAPRVWTYEEKTTELMTMGQAVLAALKNNRRIHIVRFDPQIAAAQPILADALFDARVGTGGSFSKTDQPVASEIESLGGGSDLQIDTFGPAPGLADLVTLDKRLRSGGSFAARAGLTYDDVDGNAILLNLNPSWRSTFTVSIEQPLVQGRGREVNELEVRIAKSNAEVADHEFERTVQELLRDVQIGYWNLKHAIMSYESMKRSASSADGTRDMLVEQFKVGRASLPDLAQGAVYSETLSVERTKSLANIQDAEQQLRVLIGRKPEDGVRLVPSEPLQTGDFAPDWEEGVRKAYERRSDLKVQAGRVRSARLALRQSAEVLRPDLDAFATMTYAGLGGDFTSAVNQTQSREFANWSVGVRYQTTLGKRGEKASRHLSELSLAREQAAMRSIEETVLAELRDAYRQVHASLGVVRHHRGRVEASNELVRSRIKLHELGMLTLEQRIDAEAIAVDAESELLIALAEYNQAIVNWQYATGGSADRPVGVFDSPKRPPNEALDLLRDPPPPPEFELPPERDLPSTGFDLEGLVPEIPPRESIGSDRKSLLDDEPGAIGPPPRRLPKPAGDPVSAPTPSGPIGLD